MRLLCWSNCAPRAVDSCGPIRWVLRSSACARRCCPLVMRRSVNDVQRLFVECIDVCSLCAACSNVYGFPVSRPLRRCAWAWRWFAA
eukprot:4353003-Pyramimonas_sp.AAC.1